MSDEVTYVRLIPGGGSVLTVYAVLVDGKQVGTVEKFRHTTHRYMHHGRIIARSYHPKRWRFLAPGEQWSRQAWETRDEAVRHGLAAPPSTEESGT